GNGDDRHDRGRDVPEEHEDHQADDQDLDGEVVLQVVDHPLDEVGPVVGRHDLDAGGQGGPDLLQALPHPGDDRARVPAVAPDDDAARDVAAAVEVADAPPELGAE